MRSVSAVALVAALLLPPAVLASASAPGAESVNTFYGAFSTGIPLAVPPHYDLTPQLSLGYSSSGGQGWVGVGWSLAGFATIERTGPGGGAPQFYDAADTFLYDGQELVPCAWDSVSPSCTSGGTHSTRIESYLRFRRTDNTWTVTAKDGTSFTLEPIAWVASMPSRWGLRSATDLHGNQVLYGWVCNEGECYPSGIDYNGTHVGFIWESRPDIYTYATGRGLVRVTWRLKAVDVQVSGSRLRGYQLAYTTTPSGRSQLASVRIFGRNATLDYSGNFYGASLPGVSVGLLSGSQGWRYEQGFDTSSTGQQLFRNQSDQKGYGNNVFDTENMDTLQFADVNGDGRQDACIRMDYGIHCYLSNGSRFEYSAAWDSRIFTASGANSEDNWRTLQFPDVTGDGKADACFRRDAGLQCCPATANGFSCVDFPGYNTSYWADASGFDQNNWKTLQFPDVNGDGRADACLRRDGGVQCLLSTGSAFAYSSGYDTYLLSDTAGFDENNWSTLRFPDINGDGKADMALRLDSGVRFWLSTGTGFSAPPVSSDIFFQDGFNQRGAGTFDEDNWRTLQFVDVNADGKADACARMDYGLHCYLSTGASFVYSSAWDTSLFSNNASMYPVSGKMDGDNWVSLRFADVNADGRADACMRMDYGISCSINNGNGFSWQSAYDTGSSGQQLFRNGSDQRGWGTFDGDNWSSLHFVDIKGDGKGHPCIRMDYGLVCYVSGAPAELVATVSNGAGGTTRVEYLPSSAWSNTNNPPVVQTVSAITVDDGRYTSSRTTFSYTGGLHDAQGRRFLGFRYARRTLPSAPGSEGTPYEETWFRQDYGSVSKAERTDVRDGWGRLLTSTEHLYRTNGGTVPHTSVEESTWEYHYDGSGQGCASWPCSVARRQVITHAYDGYGNVTEEVNHGDYDVSGDERTARYLYRPNTSAYIVGKAAVTDTWMGVDTWGRLLSQTLVYYDGAGTWDTPPVRGKATSSYQWHDRTGSYVSTHSGFDARGNLVAQAGSLGARTTYGIDGTYNRFVVSTTTPNGRTATQEWDPVCGVKTRVVDATGDVASMQYDEFCRITRQDQPGGRWQVFRYNDSGDVWSQYREVESNSLDGVNASWRREYYDGLDRVYRMETNGPSAGVTILKDTYYNARGETSYESTPYYSNESPSWTSFEHDALDRVVRVIHPDQGTTTHAFTHLSVTTTNPMGQQRVEVMDAFDRTVERRESSENGWVVTRYAFDARGNVERITDHAGNIWSFGYDSLNRKVWSSDPDHGYWTYEYDAAGHELAHTDAKGQRTTYEYDSNDRVRARTTRAGTAQAERTTWTYDETRPGYANFGQLTTMADATGSWTYDYDGAGNLARATRVQDGVPYTFEYGHGPTGQVLWTRYPDGDMVGSPDNPLRYDAVGRLKAIPGLVNDATYTADGQLREHRNANGTLTTYGYALAQPWVTSVYTRRGDGSLLQNLSYQRNALGRTVRVTSPFPNESWEYQYDGRNQLTSMVALQSQGGGSWSTTWSPYNQAFGYDVSGNLTYNSALGYYSYAAPGSARPHAVLAAGGSSYAYDANGNLVSGGGRTFEWNGDNLPTRINDTTFAYDGQGRRVRKTSGGVTTLTIGNDFAVSGGIRTKYISLGGRAVAKRMGTTSFWLHGDDKGSIQVITDAAGNEVQRFGYKPYGERLSASTPHAESLGFTGQRQDETGLLYLHARYYDPVLGRFLSPDPTLSSEDSIGLNRYAYAGNDPVNLTDGDGLGWFSSFWRGVSKTWRAIWKPIKRELQNLSRLPVVGGLLGLPLMVAYVATGDFQGAAQLMAVSIIQTFAATLTVMTGGIASPLLVIGANAAIGFASGAATAIVQGKTGKDILKAGIWGASTSAASAAFALYAPDVKSIQSKGGNLDGNRAYVEVDYFDDRPFRAHVRISGVSTNMNGFTLKGLYQDAKDIASNRIGRLSRTGLAVAGRLNELKTLGVGPENVTVTGHSLGSWDALMLGRQGYAGGVFAFGTPGLAANVVMGNIPGVKLRVVTGMVDAVSLMYYTPVAALSHTLNGQGWSNLGSWCHSSSRCYGYSYDTRVH